MSTKEEKPARPNSSLRRGDTVMVIAGGNHTKRPNKGKVGKILRFTGKNKDRVIVEGLNMITKHLKAKSPTEKSGRIQREASIHVSNVMFYAEAIKRPVRLKLKVLENGTKVRGYTDPKSKEFVQLPAEK